MKRLIISFSINLITCICQGQSIDTAALHILQKSYDKLAAMKSIAYRMNMVDTMIRENIFTVRRSTVRGTIKKNEYWHLSINNKLEWLVRGDTLYKKENPNIPSVTFTTDWNKHEVTSASIHTILGTARPSLGKSTASLQFVQDTSAGEFYVIEEAFKKMDYETDETEDILHFGRYFIHKESLLASRRIKYAKWLDRGEEVVDIYDFTASLDSNPIPFNSAVFFAAPPVKEKDRFQTLKIGTIAPPLKATDVRTGKAVSLAALKGKVVLLDFWYLSCWPCRALMPKIQKLHEKFGKENVVVIGINVRDSAPNAIMHFLNEKHISYPQYYQTGQLLASDYKLQAFPTTLVLGKDGKIKLVETGLGANTELKLEQAIRKELEFKGPN